VYLPSEEIAFKGHLSFQDLQNQINPNLYTGSNEPPKDVNPAFSSGLYSSNVYIL
jgi:hypothetical protein